ncbi:hypothetical protein R1521_32795 [Rhizobium brockwellii]|uniref:DUF4760 domain-containing protein n=1 Tax=Rhizobium brockwellii TaxID=3019932 RepID=A0ABU3YWR2_9HYPH|nr:hypothetical protein [Rhizobium brockwellii]MDV4183281.1 hypothetical protein [Rhizobium brockwellii]MDV4190292.1 hypothetical protein [Rhizobium brockwellii]
MLNKNYCVAVVSALALAAFVVVMWLSPSIFASAGWSMCLKEQCSLQSWLGALSGWVGAVVTLATLFVVIRQQKQETKRLLRPLDLLCERVIVACGHLRDEGVILLAGKQMILEEGSIQWQGMESCVEAIGRLYGILPLIRDEFSLNIANTDRLSATMDMRVQALSKAITNYRDQVQSPGWQWTKLTPEDVANRITPAVEAVEQYCDFCVSEAESFMRR